jgi:hypothetical protein
MERRKMIYVWPCFSVVLSSDESVFWLLVHMILFLASLYWTGSHLFLFLCSTCVLGRYYCGECEHCFRNEMTCESR